MNEIMKLYFKLLPVITLITFLMMFNGMFLMNFLKKRKENKTTKVVYTNDDSDRCYCESVDDPYFNLIKYCKNGKTDINFIKNSLSKKTHPHIKIIEDNFEMLKDLIDKNQRELDMTINEKRKHMIETELYDVVNKYIELINNLNVNLINEELDFIINLSEETESLLESLNEDDEECIKNFTELYSYFETKPVNNNDSNIQVLLVFLNNINYANYNILKKLIINNDSNYYQPLMNLLNTVIVKTNNLNEKKEYISSEMVYGIDTYIKVLMINFAKIVIKLDDIYIPPINHELKRYSELLDSVNNDIKNNNAIF